MYKTEFYMHAYTLNYTSESSQFLSTCTYHSLLPIIQQGQSKSIDCHLECAWVVHLQTSFAAKTRAILILFSSSIKPSGVLKSIEIRQKIAHRRTRLLAYTLPFEMSEDDHVNDNGNNQCDHVKSLTDYSNRQLPGTADFYWQCHNKARWALHSWVQA